MSIKHPYYYLFFSGILLSLPWLGSIFTLTMLIAFVPLLLWERIFCRSPREAFLFSSIVFFTWNAGTTWWITFASLPGAISAMLINTFLFSAVFTLYHFTRTKIRNLAGSFALVVYWTTFEFIYLNTEISWPWLNLGNGLAKNIHLVQWYEYTGALGGTIWILTTNLLITEIINTKIKKSWLWGIFLATFIIPLVISISIFYKREAHQKSYTVAILQPNLNPYTKVSHRSRINNLINLADTIKENVDLYVAPEIALTENIHENKANHSHTAKTLNQFLSRHPGSAFILGTYSFETNQSSNLSFYNSAAFVTGDTINQFYHKSKLVTGIEKMPYPKSLAFLSKIAESLGGSMQSYETQKTRDIFTLDNNNLRIAPVICYESVYGEFVTGFVKNNANLIVNITNDSWWGNTPGHKQLLSYSSLRAIETRRCIVRSASTGVSAFINNRGEITSSLPFNHRNVLIGEAHVSSYTTFYVKHGDYVGWIALILSIFAIGFTVTKSFLIKPKAQKF